MDPTGRVDVAPGLASVLQLTVQNPSPARCRKGYSIPVAFANCDSRRQVCIRCP